MRHGCDETTVVYHSREWDILACNGWQTLTVDEYKNADGKVVRIAHMIFDRITASYRRW